MKNKKRILFLFCEYLDPHKALLTFNDEFAKKDLIP